jgi:hypothetical protein
MTPPRLKRHPYPRDLYIKDREVKGNCSFPFSQSGSTILRAPRKDRLDTKPEGPSFARRSPYRRFFAGDGRGKYPPAHRRASTGSSTGVSRAIHRAGSKLQLLGGCSRRQQPYRFGGVAVALFRKQRRLSHDLLEDEGHRDARGILLRR